ncbi:hypothetical protein [Pedosphaera parvula]|uniref:Uncharacterized protein n=1 Tax=Pedosphaera parvula (strain Ellin514) TaxID=320771 RepID=B9XEQ6_PEDPL|nr:hypothetical protein [Pedosphaera parvula]EEF61770.1 hypothetical protein Cflav_PD4810 [Pedosphaera parvula Ellin514]
MKQELDRIKKDVETIEKAMGLVPSMGREWIQWMKRDRWFNLLWCLPGFILIAATLLPVDHAKRYLGLVSDQWAGVLVVVALIGIASGHTRKVTREDGRPESMIRESKRINGMTAQGLWFGLALVVQVLLFFVWGRSNHIAFGPFWSGLFILMGSTCLVAALVARAWILLGYAIPFLAYGLSLPLTGGNHKVNGVLFGAMFIAVALSFAFIQIWQIRRIEGQHETH